MRRPHEAIKRSSGPGAPCTRCRSIPMKAVKVNSAVVSTPSFVIFLLLSLCDGTIPSPKKGLWPWRYPLDDEAMPVRSMGNFQMNNFVLFTILPVFSPG